MSWTLYAAGELHRSQHLENGPGGKTAAGMGKVRVWLFCQDLGFFPYYGRHSSSNIMILDSASNSLRVYGDFNDSLHDVINNSVFVMVQENQ